MAIARPWSGISTSFAAYKGVNQLGQMVTFNTPFGPVRLNRTTSMTTVGTLRVIAHAFDSIPGDYLFSRRTGEKSLDISHFLGILRNNQIGFSRLAIECGLKRGQETSVAVICHAVGLDPNSSAEDLARRFKRWVESSLLPCIPIESF